MGYIYRLKFEISILHQNHADKGMDKETFKLKKIYFG